MNRRMQRRFCLKLWSDTKFVLEVIITIEARKKNGEKFFTKIY